jgi:hypothetical protein
MTAETSDRFAWVSRWLQAQDEELDYYPDASSVPSRLPDIRIRPRRYVLVGRTPVLEPNGRAWEEWFLQADRTVARTSLTPSVDVVTAFLGMDAPHPASGRPLLFETLALGLVEPGPWCVYSATWRGAEVAHRRMCRRARACLSSHPGTDGS